MIRAESIRTGHATRTRRRRQAAKGVDQNSFGVLIDFDS